MRISQIQIKPYETDRIKSIQGYLFCLILAFVFKQQTGLPCFWNNKEKGHPSTDSFHEQIRAKQVYKRKNQTTFPTPFLNHLIVHIKQHKGPKNNWIGSVHLWFNTEQTTFSVIVLKKIILEQNVRWQRKHTSIPSIVSLYPVCRYSLVSVSSGQFGVWG